MKRLLIILVLLAFSATSAFAVGSVVPTSTVTSGDLVIVTFTWIANSSAPASVPATSSSTKWPRNLPGCIYKMETNPGTTAPTTLYDITLTDEDGADLLGGVGADRSATATEIVVPKIGPVYGCSSIEKAFTLNITNNSVNSATGTVRVYIYED